jgi:cytochrome d ubiquinol oxidase subunit I
MDLLTLGRAFMGVTLAFHIFFALFGVGIPLLISLAEFIGIAKKDEDFLLMARRWTFAMAVLFVVGAISGTIVAVTLSLLLPTFMAITSKVVILPFFMETFAFFVEAIFLGIYAYSWNDWKGKWAHWLCSLPIVIASAASGFLITTVNAWMTAPAGFSYANGVIANVNQWAAMWNAATPTRTTHSIVSYYATAAFCFAALAAMQLLRKRRATSGNARRYYEKMVMFTMALAFLFSIATVASGDSAARYIAGNEPQKFAAAEGIMYDQANAPLVIGGVYDPARQTWQGGIAIPGALSFFMGGSLNVVVRGLESFDPSTWPPLIIHDFFDSMAIIGILMFLVPLIFFVLWCTKKWRRGALQWPMLAAIFITGILSIVAVELGWMLTEIGRQPWTIRGILLTKDSFTTSHVVLAYAFVFPVLYVVLFIATVRILLSHYRRNQI